MTQVNMDKEALKQQVFAAIDREQALEFLESLVCIPSEVFKPTYAQELVKNKLAELGFEVDAFPCAVEEIKDLADFHSHPQNYQAPESIQNVVGMKHGGAEDADNSFLVFAHIDTAEVSPLMPDTNVTVKDGRIYGLGVADDKSGVAMMLLGAQAALQQCPALKGRLTLMSTIGKRGAVGTLTSILRGYKAGGGVYIHPAETGHGFKEIKSYSMGHLDFHLTVTGKAGVYRDEIDDSEISAILKGHEVIAALMDWDKLRRQKYKFKESSFAGRPNTKINVLAVQSSELVRDDALRFDADMNMVFGLEETVYSVLEDMRAYLKEYFADDPWLSANPPQISMGIMKASPAYIARDTRIAQTIEANIQAIKNFKAEDFIYQYHASSDIRMPIIYGHTPTIGIGPLCGGLNANQEVEWLDIEDYIAGIKIVAGMIIDWCL